MRHSSRSGRRVLGVLHDDVVNIVMPQIPCAASALTYLLTCYLTRVAHHYRLYTGAQGPGVINEQAVDIEYPPRF